MGVVARPETSHGVERDLAEERGDVHARAVGISNFSVVAGASGLD